MVKVDGDGGIDVGGVVFIGGDSCEGSEDGCE